MEHFCQSVYTDGQQAHEKMFSITNHQGSVNQNHHITSDLSEQLLSKRQQITSIRENAEKRECSLLWIEKSHTATMENSAKFPQKLKNKITISSVQFNGSVVSDSLQPHESQHATPPCPSSSPYDPAIPTLGIYLSKENKNSNLKTYMHPHVH